MAEAGWPVPNSSPQPPDGKPVLSRIKPKMSGGKWLLIQDILILYAIIFILIQIKMEMIFPFGI